MYLIKNHYHTIYHFCYHKIQEIPFVLTNSPFKYLSKHEYRILLHKYCYFIKN